MIPFAAPLDDILFSLRYVAQYDTDTSADILGHFASFAEGEIAPLNATGDAQGAHLIGGRVRMPDGFRDVYAAMVAGGWQGLTLPEAFGGMGQDGLIAAGVSEIFSGANHALQMVCNLVPGAAKILLQHGNAEQQQRWLPRLASGQTLATMCLTEAGAGSDLSRISCRAILDGDAWRVTGEKIFISGGDQDLSEDILHFVLARTGPEPLKGLSLFLVPASAEVRVTRLEEKLGLHASPTCQMQFDGAVGTLIGAQGAGLAVMFTLMNHARLDVALQGVAHAARAGQIARAYAANRLQGRNADGRPTALHDHADVARMLDLQDALAMGARGMCHVTHALIAAKASEDLIGFLTPLCKIHGSDAGTIAADLGIQVLGGYGYLTEYGLSQIWRDARITRIYEGANGIHARALATRGLRSNGPELFGALIRDLSADNPRVMQALVRWRAKCAELRAHAAAEPLAHDFAQCTVRLFSAAVWTRMATCAEHHPDTARIRRVSASVLSGLDAGHIVY